MKIILDTNFIIKSFDYKVDIKTELDRICSSKYELFIIDKTIDEIKKLNNSSLALSFANSVSKISTTGGHVDDSIVQNLNNDTVVATQDKALKEKIKNKGAQIIIIRQKNHLEFER